MKLALPSAGQQYKSASQISRIVTEKWVAENFYCPSCGEADIAQFPANKPLADFYCPACASQYELKSQGKAFGKSISNGAYATKLERLKSDTSPNLVLLQYDPTALNVAQLQVIPRGFFVRSIIEKRKPLGPHARRAGWVGSRIHLHMIPNLGRITIVERGVVVEKEDVLRNWRRTSFLNESAPDSRGWLVDVMACIDKINAEQFTLNDVYSFEDHLRTLYPRNKNVRPKIRQQLQVLRDSGYLTFLGNGNYRKAK